MNKKKQLGARITHKHDIEANWLKAENFVPLKGEIIIYDKDENYSYERIKIGDGAQQVNDLPFYIQTQINGLLELVYPKGAIYISTISTNPSVLFGFGTWEQIKDTFLLSAGDTYTAGSTGGEATHILTIDEMPSHTHTYQTAAWVNRTGDIVDSSNNEYIDYEINRQTQVTGGSQPHNNMPPYLAVYMWKRVS